MSDRPVFMEIFAQRLKEVRKERKKKQKELAAHFGITLRAYQFYESAANYPDVAGLIKLVDYLDISIDYLLGRTDER